ncbi:MAG: heme-binding protein [Marinovum sp.]|nr:heme-binding protein [Marinovum sp.]
MAAAVLDPSGHVVASGRMDGALAPILDFTIDKAYTSTMGNTSHAFAERMNSSVGLPMGAANRPRLCAWDGGVPIYEGSALIGALGVSGATGQEDIQTAAVAEVGLSTIFGQ